MRCHQERTLKSSRRHGLSVSAEDCPGAAGSNVSPRADHGHAEGCLGLHLLPRLPQAVALPRDPRGPAAARARRAHVLARVGPARQQGTSPRSGPIYLHSRMRSWSALPDHLHPWPMDVPLDKRPPPP